MRHVIHEDIQPLFYSQLGVYDSLGNGVTTQECLRYVLSAPDIVGSIDKLTPHSISVRSRTLADLVRHSREQLNTDQLSRPIYVYLCNAYISSFPCAT